MSLDVKAIQLLHHEATAKTGKISFQPVLAAEDLRQQSTEAVGILLDEIATLKADLERLREAIRLTREYVGERTLPAVEGWSWYDAVVATGGVNGFGECGRALDPDIHGRGPLGDLRYCALEAGHEGDHLENVKATPTPGEPT